MVINSIKRYLQSPLIIYPHCTYGSIDVMIFEGEGGGLLSDLSSQVAEQTLEEMGKFINKHLG